MTQSSSSPTLKSSTTGRFASGPSNAQLPSTLHLSGLDVLPTVVSLLARLKDPITASSSLTVASQTPGPTSPLSTPSQQLNPVELLRGRAPLAMKDLSTATDGIEAELQRVRAQVKELPDVERTVEEQEEEMREWERKIQEQRKVLETMRSGAFGQDGDVTTEDAGNVMKGIE